MTLYCPHDAHTYISLKVPSPARGNFIVQEVFLKEQDLGLYPSSSRAEPRRGGARNSIYIMHRLLLGLLMVTSAVAFAPLHGHADRMRRRRFSSPEDESAATDMTELMAKQHKATIDAVQAAKQEVYDTYAQQVKDLEERVAAAET